MKVNGGTVPIDFPRVWDGSFVLDLICKGQMQINGIGDKIIELYAAGLSTREIRSHLEEVYGLQVSADIVSLSVLPRQPLPFTGQQAQVVGFSVRVDQPPFTGLV